MDEYIGCRNCNSPNCKGCNIKTLEMMLNNGKFDCLMNENRCINPAADVAPVVRCKHCTDGIMSNDNKYIICCRLGVGMEFDDFCSHGERKDEGIGYVAD